MIRMKDLGDFPGSPVVDSELPIQGARVQSLVRELRSHMLQCGQGKKKKRKKKTWALSQMIKSEAKSDLLRKKHAPRLI